MEILPRPGADNAPAQPATPSADAPAPARRGRTAALVNMAWLLGDKGLALLVGLAIVGLIGRTFGPTGSGHFAYASAMLQTALGLSMVCAGAVLLPRFCRLQNASGSGYPRSLTGTLANVFALRMVASVVAALAMMAFCWATVDEPDRRIVSTIMLLAVPLIEPFYIFATYWLSRNHNKPTVVARSSGLLLRATLVVLGIWLGAPLWLLAAAWVVEAALNALLQTLQIRRALPKLFRGNGLCRCVRPQRMKRYLAFGIRFVLSLWLAQVFLRIDRLILAEHLDPHDFGIYAAPMQLVEVWSQVAYLVGSSVATAYLYRHLHNARQRTRAFLITAGLMAGIGLLGLLGAWLLGPLLLRVVFGHEFDGSLPFLVAGAAYAVLLFADQAVDMLVMANNQPWLLTFKWAVALATAAITIAVGFAHFGALVGPMGLASGIVAAWLALYLAPSSWRSPPRPRSSQGSPSQTGPLPADTPSAAHGGLGEAGVADKAGHVQSAFQPQVRR